MKGFQYLIICFIFLMSSFFSVSLSAFQLMEVSSHPITGAQLVSASDHSCIIVAGSVYCWGKNDYGQLGNGTYVSSDIPVKVQGITNATALSAYEKRSCAVLSDGTATCWGLNDYSKLNNPAINMVLYNNTPLPVAGVKNALTIAEGDSFVCVLTKSETVNCWGENFDGQLGTGNYLDSTLPVSALGLTNVSMLASGFRHSCALIKDGTVKCWGSNIDGELGDGTYTDYESITPVLVNNIADATAISAGGNHSCVIVKGGDVLCWGKIMNELYSKSAKPISEIDNAVAVSSSDSYVCILMQDANVKCLGKEWEKNLSKYKTYLSNVAILATGGGQCGILKDGTVNCWSSTDDTPKVINLDPALIQTPVDTMMCEKADLTKAQADLSKSQQDTAACMSDLNKAKTKIHTLQATQSPACNYIKLLPPYMQKLPAAMAQEYGALYQRISHYSGCQ